jgi:hypothetical protein
VSIILNVDYAAIPGLGGGPHVQRYSSGNFRESAQAEMLRY